MLLFFYRKDRNFLTKNKNFLRSIISLYLVTPNYQLLMKKITLFVLATIAGSFFLNAYGQVGISTSTPKAALDIPASDPANPLATDGFLIPRISKFPSTNPTADQHGMLIFMTKANAFQVIGFHYWNNPTTEWIRINNNQWSKDMNASSKELIYAYEAEDDYNDVVITEDGYLGAGTDMPDSELHVYGKRIAGINTSIELTVENSTDAAELRLNPGGVDSPDWTFTASDNTTDGLKIYEDNDERVQIKAGGEFRVDDLRSSKNTGMQYPATVYVKPDGTLGVKTAYSRLDDLKVNLLNFATPAYAESKLELGISTTAALYTHTLTPTQDILLEVSCHISVDFTKYGSSTNFITEKHNTKLYGIKVRLNGVDYTNKSMPFIGNSGLNGDFHASDHLYIPLVADGTTYNITIHGFVQNDYETGTGIRGNFGGNPMDRLQIVENK